MRTPPLTVRFLRGGFLEATHQVHVVLVENGRVTRAAGEPDQFTWFRSGAKPIQAMALLESGAGSPGEISTEELAIAAASHNAEEEHLRAVHRLLDRFSLSEEDLACGAHRPIASSASDRLAAAGEVPRPIHNNCSGKHAAMLAAARALGAPTDGYLSPDHPVQRLNLENVSLLTGVGERDVSLGIDGCSAPVFGVALSTMALAFARLASPPPELPPAKREALLAVTGAMREHPFLIAGTNRTDTGLMQASAGRLVTKIGAEGLQLIGERETGRGLAIKVTDGNSRAYMALLPSLLRSLGFLSADEVERLPSWASNVLTNCRGTVVGSVEVEEFPW